MARILLAWELGANLGHVAPLRIMAQRLRTLGHHCAFAVRNLRSAEELLSHEFDDIVQAPISHFRPPEMQSTRSYANLLHQCGFADELDLAGRLRAWRQLFTAQQAQLVYADHAPTALLAARTMQLPVVNVGTGFFITPLATPLPAFGATPVPAAELVESEMRVLGNINRALQRLKLAPLDSLQQMFDGQQARILSYPELDHFHVPRREPFVGTLDIAHGHPLDWPAAPGPRVLAYLQHDHNLEKILAVLQRSPGNVLVRVSGTAARGFKQFERPRMAITDKAINLRHLAAGCDLVLNYASHGFVVDALRAGKPAVLLPDTTERTLVARRVEMMGAGMAAIIGQPFKFADAFTQVLETPGFREAAQTFAARHAALTPEETLRRVVDEPLQALGLQ